jgi:ATP-dependent Clp protease ATP-binding subunit ClpC
VLAEIKHIFRPEFLNRVDETMVFDPLGAKELEQLLIICWQSLTTE